MNTHMVHGALISTDASYRESVKQVLGGAEHGVELSVEITVACTEINEAQVEELRRAALDLVLLDFERDPTTGSNSRPYLPVWIQTGSWPRPGRRYCPNFLPEPCRPGLPEYSRNPFR